MRSLEFGLERVIGESMPMLTQERCELRKVGANLGGFSKSGARCGDGVRDFSSVEQRENGFEKPQILAAIVTGLMRLERVEG